MSNEPTVTTASGITIPESDRVAIEKNANRKAIVKTAAVLGLVATGWILRGKADSRGIELPISKIEG